MAAHPILRGVWTKILPRPALVQGSTLFTEVVTAATEPSALDSGIIIREDGPTVVPSGTDDVWARIHPLAAWPNGTLRTLEATPAPE
jgi:hypothetical protein